MDIEVCDVRGCPAVACISVDFSAGALLVFCGHHFRQLEPALGAGKAQAVGVLNSDYAREVASALVSVGVE